MDGLYGMVEWHFSRYGGMMVRFGGRMVFVLGDACVRLTMRRECLGRYGWFAYLILSSVLPCVMMCGVDVSEKLYSGEENSRRLLSRL
jgi:hypothetical protein